MTTCNEIGVKVEIVPVDLQKGEHKTEEYLSTKHPFGIIPVLEVCSSVTALLDGHQFLTCSRMRMVSVSMSLALFLATSSPNTARVLVYFRYRVTSRRMACSSKLPASNTPHLIHRHRASPMSLCFQSESAGRVWAMRC
jgi:hypothetical protein